MHGCAPAAGGRSGRRTAPEEPSPRQSQTARFVAAGANDREVAARLFLNPRTAGHHLRGVLCGGPYRLTSMAILPRVWPSALRR
ncbi:DNA-binding CsgD family transcriptional regulator [Spinactinospora alkalitolerans]|uniref:DNA-binding CsgD family transcriptional regulator n=1 Tax=Spinactinospora alkalitolerans TaxID=687207 RepID=A0A852TXR1_9ACTN|nr:DNA-binding CsgD family transcriptional regulator [Spinactinospora alkalitolerans]